MVCAPDRLRVALRSVMSLPVLVGHGNEQKAEPGWVGFSDVWRGWGLSEPVGLGSGGARGVTGASPAARTRLLQVRCPLIPGGTGGPAFRILDAFGPDSPIRACAFRLPCGRLAMVGPV